MDSVVRVPLGSNSRFIPKQLSGNLKVGDFLGDSFLSLPLHYSDVRAIRLLRYADRDEQAWGDVLL